MDFNSFKDWAFLGLLSGGVYIVSFSSQTSSANSRITAYLNARQIK